MSTVTTLVEMDFGAGYVDVTPDVVGSIDVRYGISGTGPLDRVASTGTMRLSLDNSEFNSAQLLGYYSPGNVNRRAGFGIGIKCRLTLTFASVPYTRFIGTIDSIRPTPGVGLERRTEVVAVDWLDYAARWRLSGIPIQLNQVSSDIFSTIIASMPIAPSSIAIAPGKDTYAYALDNAKSGQATALSEFQRIAQSELGFIYIVGDQIRFLNRHVRMANTVNQFMLDQTIGLEASRSRGQILNRVQVVVYPRRADASLVVLFTLDTPFQVAPAQVVTIRASYTDPTLRAEKVGATELVAPVATTDYVMNVAADGSGADLTANFSVVAIFGASEVHFTVTNSGSQSGFVTKLQCRGKGVYDYSTAMGEAKDTASIAQYGENALTFDMFYQNDPERGAQAAAYILNVYKGEGSFVQSVSFPASRSDALMVAALGMEISDRVGIRETVTGLTDDGPGTTVLGHHIQNIALTIEPDGILWCTWGLCPADAAAYWILGQAGASELDATTKLGFL